jgi:hypothetical protein
MRVRRETAEHPFAMLKMRMGATHFLMKTLPRVATEMALHVLAYHLTQRSWQQCGHSRPRSPVLAKPLYWTLLRETPQKRFRTTKTHSGRGAMPCR